MLSRLRSQAWLVAAALGFVCFVIFASTASRTSLSNDVYSADYGAWHLATTGSPWLEHTDLPPKLADHPLLEVWVQQAPNGHTAVTRAPGAVALSLAAYWLAGSDHMQAWPSAITAAAATALSVVLMFLALRTLLSLRQAVGVSCVFAFTTPAWTVAANGMWPHTVTLLGISGMAWSAATRRWVSLGLFGGLLVWGRIHAAIIVGLLGLLLALWRRSPGIVLRVAIPSLSALGLECVWTHWMYGSWDPRSSYGASVTVDRTTLFSVVNQAGLWLSPGRGILVWSPVLLLLGVALVRSWQEQPDWTRALFVSGVTYTAVQGALQGFTGGDHFYSERYGLEFLACATPALAVSWHRAGRLARALMPGILALQATAIATGAVFDTVFIRYAMAWRRNEFVSALDLTWPAGPAVLVIILGTVVALQVSSHRQMVRQRGLADHATASATGGAADPLIVS